MSELNFCVWCGYKLDHSEKFCPRCGSDLTGLMDKKTKVQPKEIKVKVKEPTKYEIKINELKRTYDKKEKNALDIIHKRFNPNEITYSRFVEQLNRNHEAFHKKADFGLELNGMIDDSPVRIENELEKTIKVLEEMLEQLKSLILEFIINPEADKKSEEEIDLLFEDMNDLIKSIKNYQ